MDLLHQCEEPEANSDLALRCQQYHTEVQRWDTLRETYFTPVVEEACAVVEDAVKLNQAAKFTRDAALISQDEQHRARGDSAPDLELAAELARTSLDGERPSEKQTTSPSEAMDAPPITVDALPPTFPWRSVAEDTGLGTDGLPPPRTPNGQCASWNDTYENTVALPSSYHPLILEQAVMRQLVNVEMDFRRPEAVRALEDVKTGIIAREVFKLQKKKVSGKGMTLRNQKAIGKVNEEIRASANMYRRHWLRLRALGMPQDDPQLRRLVDADLEHFDVSLERDLGKSKRAASWLWENFSFVDSEQDPRYQTFYNDGTYTLFALRSPTHWLWCSTQGPLVPVERAVCSLDRRSRHLAGGNETYHQVLRLLGTMVARPRRGQGSCWRAGRGSLRSQVCAEATRLEAC